MRCALFFIMLFTAFSAAISLHAAELAPEQKRAMLRFYLRDLYGFEAKDQDQFFKQLESRFVSSTEMNRSLSAMNVKMSGNLPIVQMSDQERFYRSLSEMVIREVERTIKNPAISVDENLKIADQFLKKTKVNVDIETTLRHLDQKIHTTLMQPGADPITHPRMMARMGAVEGLFQIGVLPKESYLKQWVEFATAGEVYSQNYADLLAIHLKESLREYQNLDPSSESILKRLLDKQVNIDRTSLRTYMFSLKTVDPGAFNEYDPKLFSLLSPREKISADLGDFDPLNDRISQDQFKKELIRELEKSGFFEKKYTSNKQLRTALFSQLSDLYQVRGRPFGPSIAYDYVALREMRFFDEVTNVAPMRKAFQALMERQFDADRISLRAGIRVTEDLISPAVFDFASERDLKFRRAHHRHYVKTYAVPAFFGNVEESSQHLLSNKIAQRYHSEYRSLFDTVLSGMDETMGRTPSPVSVFKYDVVREIDQEITHQFHWADIKNVNPEVKKGVELILRHTPPESIYAIRARVMSVALAESLESVNLALKNKPELAKDFKTVFKNIVHRKPQEIMKEHHLLKQLLRMDLKSAYPESKELVADLMKLREKIFYHDGMDWRGIRAVLGVSYPAYVQKNILNNELLEVVNATHFQLSQVPLETLDAGEIAEIKRSVEWSGQSKNGLREMYGKYPNDEMVSTILNEKVDRVLFDRKLITLEEYQESFWKLAKGADRMGGVELEHAINGYSNALKGDLVKSIKDKTLLKPGLDSILDQMQTLEPKRLQSAHQVFSEHLKTMSYDFQTEVNPKLEKMIPAAPPPIAKKPTGFARLISRLCGKKGN